MLFIFDTEENQMKTSSILSKFFITTMMLMLMVMVPLSTVNAATPIFVQPGGDDVLCDGTVPVDYSVGLTACAVKTIQQGIDLVDPGGAVNVAAGTYVENIVVDKPAVISGAGSASTTIYPAVSNPACAGSLCGSNIFLVQAGDVAISGFTLDGDNPAIVSGYVVGGADIDARNGIIENFSLGVYDNLEVSDTTVQNIYFRGIYMSSGGSGFNIHDNLIQNVRGDVDQGNAIMNWAGSGMIQGNTVIDASDGIVSNHSSGTQYLNNTVRNTPVGIHTDNNGSYGGVADLIQGNLVEDCSTDGYGIFVFAPRLASSVNNNTITNCSVGLAAMGQGAVTTPTFTNNMVDGESLTGSIGIVITTSLGSWGTADVSASFSNNLVANTATAVSFETDTDESLSATLINNSFTNYDDGALTSGLGTYSVNGSCNWWGTRAGFTETAPLATGLTFAPWLVYGTDGSLDIGYQLPASFTVTPPGDVSEAENDFTTLDNALGCAVDGQTIDINGPYTWATSNPFANTAYLASYADTDYGDIRGLEIPEGVDDLTITSTLGTAHILGAGDVDDSGTIIFSSFLFGEDAPGNTNLTIENLLIEDFENAITLGWNNVGSFNDTMIQDNEIILAGDNSDDSDWMQNIAFNFWVGSNQTIQNNTVTFQADGLHTGTSTSASFGYQSGTSGSGYNGLVIDGNTFQVGDTSNGTEQVYGIWENSHSDSVGTTIHLTNNQFLGRAGDDFDHAFRLTSQTDGLLISGNILDRVDEVFMAMKSSYHTDGDHYAFTGNTLINVGGADGIFLDNMTYQDTPYDIPIYWDISNTIDGETGIRGLNELSTDATHAVRPSSGATVIDSVFITPVNTTPVFVDAGWTGEDRFSDPDGIGVGSIVAYAYNGFDTIQAGVDAVTSGGVVNVAAGTYEENVVVNKIVSILGAGSANTASDTIVTSPLSVDYKVGVFQITATGNSGAIILLSDMQVQPIGQAGVSIGRFTESTGTSVAFLTLDNLFVIGTNNNAQTEQERGLYVDLTSTLDHLTVIDSAFNNLAYGWYFQKAVSADASTVSNVSVTNTTFNHNNLKGLYTEKLTEASFIDCTFSENGYDGTGLPSYFIPWMSGVDINLKAGTYQNLAFLNPTVTNNALGGSQHGVGLAIKARDDGSTYGAFPATLDGVMISGGNFTGNERGIRIGEPGKNNAGPTDVAILLNRIFANEKTYTGSDGSAYGGIINYSLAAVAAENNWWGCNEGPTSDGLNDCDSVIGTVDADPWLVLDATIPAGNYKPGYTYIVEGNLTFNSDDQDTSLIGTITDWVKAIFTEYLGIFTPSEENFTNGLVSSEYVPVTSGAETICVNVDNESICEDRIVLFMMYLPIITK
jgi:hypothetical protein